MVFKYAHKKGEVVGPAGGGTGGPHCLAEDYKLLKAALFHLFKEPLKNNNSDNPVKQKTRKEKNSPG